MVPETSFEFEGKFSGHVPVMMMLGGGKFVITSVLL